jgi:hypothetical protein
MPGLACMKPAPLAPFAGDCCQTRRKWPDFVKNPENPQKPAFGPFWNNDIPFGNNDIPSRNQAIPSRNQAIPSRNQGILFRPKGILSRNHAILGWNQGVLQGNGFEILFIRL